MSARSSHLLAPSSVSGDDPSSSIEVVAPKLSPSALRPRTLGELHALLRDLYSRENPDVVLPLSELKVDERGLVLVPGHGGFAMTDWARRQLAARLGIVWDRWFAPLEAAERAAEISLRLSRSRERVRLRTASFQDPGRGLVPVLRAFVSESYSPISDALLVEMLSDVLGDAAGEVSQISITDMAVTYAFTVGRIFRPGGDHQVGDVQGGIQVRNSGVGYAGLNVSGHLRRLLCLNGMILPVKDPVILACIHRGVDAYKLRAKLVERTREIGGAFARGADRLLEARRYYVSDREAVFRVLLARAKQPRKYLEALEASYLREPEPNAFGMVQAVTRASQDAPPEVRYELERAATGYLAALGLGE